MRAFLGVNSLVKGEIPPESLAVGSPAKVIRQSPDFPTTVSEEERVEILREILREMVKYFEFYDISCEHTGGNYLIRSVSKGLLKASKRVWRLMVRYTDGKEECTITRDERCDLFLSLPMLDNEMRGLLSGRKITWIDLNTKERSSLTNDLADEVALFFTRYGVRLTRVT